MGLRSLYRAMTCECKTMVTKVEYFGVFSMRAVGPMSFLMLIVLSFILLCVVAFAGDDFRKRHDWRPKKPSEEAERGAGNSMWEIDLGRLFCVWLYRFWWFILLVTLYYFFGGKNVA